MTTVSVVGLGYIGLPTAAILATHGFRVIGVDTNPAVVQAISSGNAHIEEPGIKPLLQKAVASGNLVAQGEVPAADVFIIAVPTPIRPDEQPDLDAVQAASAAIAPRLRRGDMVLLESTVPPGTTANAVAPLLEVSGLKAGVDFFLAHCPERVLPGNILRELAESDRIIGGIDTESGKRAADLYRTFVSGKLYLTDATTAEVEKLSENTFRDVNIALANELASICYKLGVDVWEVIDLANKHPRVNLLQPGPGVGGHCIPVDPWFLVSAAPELAQLIRTSRKINDTQPRLVAQLVLRMLDNRPQSKVVVLGVTYKANVDDIRESPALEVIHALEEAGALVSAHDPHAQAFGRPLMALEEAFHGADAAVVLVDHKEFEKLDPYYLGALMRSRKVLDTRHCLDAGQWRHAGFQVSVLGVRHADA